MTFNSARSGPGSRATTSATARVSAFVPLRKMTSAVRRPPAGPSRPGPVITWALVTI